MDLIRYDREWFLYFLFLIPLFIIIYFFIERKKNNLIKSFFNEDNYKLLIGNFSNRKKISKFILQIVSISFLIIAIANPKIGTKIKEVNQVGIDIFIALDVSKSMLAEDILPNRLEKAKLEISQLVSRLNGDRIGLIIFAGESFVQFPLTNDYNAANMFLDAIDENSISTQGTAIGNAITQSINSFQFDEKTEKVLILITDGENTEGEIIQAANDASKKGIKIFTVGMGNTLGVPIPIKNENGEKVDYKRDKSGNMILSKLDESGLVKISEIGNGKYFRASNSQNEINEIYNYLQKFEKSEYKKTQFSDYEDQFQYFIFLSLFLLIIEIFLSENKVYWKKRFLKIKKTKII